MRIIGLDEDLTRLEKEGAITKLLGEPIELQSLRKKDNNVLLKTILNTACKSDKYMIRYHPYNKIIIDPDVYSATGAGDIGFKIDKNEQAIRIGRTYKNNKGYLCFTGELSENGLLEHQFKLKMYKYNNKNLIMNKVLLLGVGQLSDGNLYGLWFVPNERGIAIQVADDERAISTVTDEPTMTDGWTTFVLEDWLKDVKIKERAS